MEARALDPGFCKFKSQPKYVIRSAILLIQYEQTYCRVCHYIDWKLPEYPLERTGLIKENLCNPQKYHVPFTRNLRARFDSVLV